MERKSSGISKLIYHASTRYTDNHARTRSPHVDTLKQGLGCDPHKIEFRLQAVVIQHPRPVLTFSLSHKPSTLDSKLSHMYLSVPLTRRHVCEPARHFDLSALSWQSEGARRANKKCNLLQSALRCSNST